METCSQAPFKFGGLITPRRRNNQKFYRIVPLGCCGSFCSYRKAYCVFGHLRLVFIWSCFVSCLCFFVLQKFLLRYLNSLGNKRNCDKILFMLLWLIIHLRAYLYMLLSKKVMESLRLSSSHPLNKEEPVCVLRNVKFSFTYWFHVIIVVVFQFKSIKYHRANQP